MPLFEFEGKRPTVHPEAFVAPTATIVGDVHVEKGASIWYGAVLRADDCAIIVREGANVQDNSVIHAGPGVTAEIGAGATIAHSCVMHGTSIGAKALLGNNSTVLDDATIGAGTLVAAGSLVTPGTAIPDGVLAQGVPCKTVKPIAGTPAQIWIDLNPDYYRELGQRHAASVTLL